MISQGEFLYQQQMHQQIAMQQAVAAEEEESAFLLLLAPGGPSVALIRNGDHFTHVRSLDDGP